MIIWATVILILAFIGIITNFLWGVPYLVSWNDVIIFLVALGMLIRMRAETKKG